MNIFEKHVKNLFWNKILALLRSILGDYFIAKNFAQIIGLFFLEKNLPNTIKNCPNGKILPNLVTLFSSFSIKKGNIERKAEFNASSVVLIWPEDKVSSKMWQFCLKEKESWRRDICSKNFVRKKFCSREQCGF